MNSDTVRAVICIPVTKKFTGLVVANSVDPSSVRPATVNICEDFVHTIEGEILIDNNGSEIVESREIIKDLLSEDWKRSIKKQYRKFMKKHILCKNKEKKIKGQHLHVFLKINKTKYVRNGSLMDVYIRASKISFILSILKTDGVKKCCLADKRLAGLYERFRIRVQANLYHTVSKELSQWNETNCTMGAAILINQPMRCEDVTNVIAIVLKDSLHLVKHLWKNMKKVAISMENKK